MDVQSLARYLGAWSAGKGSLQQKLARALMQAIRHGGLNPGIRLPSERALAEALTLSRTTVVAAYDALREGGWVESRSGSGTRVCARSPVVFAARGAAQAGTLAASPLMGLLANHEEDDIIDFALGSPAPLTELGQELFTLPADEYASLTSDRHYYPLGISTLRHAIAAHYTAEGLETRKEQILVTNGAQQAIALCAALYLQRGDSALVEDPVYFGALDAFRAAGARLFTLPVEEHGVPPAVIHDRITATAARLIYLTPAYQNPTGAVMPKAARKELVRIVSEFGVPVIDDRTLADLNLEGAAVPPLAAIADVTPVITIGSLSKLVWAGLRVGWVRAAEPVIDRLARLKSMMDLGSPLLTQAIAVRLLGAVEEARRLRRAELRPRRDLLAALLEEHLPEWSFRVPAGGLFLWVKLPEGDAREFGQVAFRHGVATVPGPTMSAVEEHAEFLRVPFLGTPETLRMAVGRLAAAWREYQSGDRRERQRHVAIV